MVRPLSDLPGAGAEQYSGGVEEDPGTGTGWFSRWPAWVTVAAGVVAVLVLVNIVLFEGNRAVQAEVARRAQFIQQTVPLETLTREIVNAIANLALRNNDDALRMILAQHGITINPAPGGPAATGGQPVKR